MSSDKDFSVIVPTHNRCRSLRRCLDSVLAQDYPEGRLEIIVVDDGSTDGTRAVLAEYARARPALRWFSQPRLGPAAARNLGLREASADIVGFTDDDCVLEKDWVRKMAQAHADLEATAIGGLTRVAPGNVRARVSQSLSDGAIHAKINGQTEVIFFPTCNVSLKKARLNGDVFDESFPLPAGEDLEFFWRLYKSGRRLVYREDIVVHHDCHPSLVSFLRQAYRYGRGNFLARHLHQDQPLLKELKTRGAFPFWAATVVNVCKIPRFAALCGRKLTLGPNAFSWKERLLIYGYFAIHKAMYIVGNAAEYRRLAKMPPEARFLKPDFVILDITHHCNLKCRICEIHKSGFGQELSTGEVKKLIRQSRDWGVRDFVLSGGEALLRPDIFSLLEHARNLGASVGVLTNGILLDEDFLKKISPFLVSGTLSLSISLDALSPHIHDGIRGVEGSFEKTRDGLKRLSALKAVHPRVNFNTISIILNENLEELLPLAEFLKSLGVDSIQFQHLLANNLVMKQRPGEAPYWVPPERFGALDRAIDGLIAFKKQNIRLVRNSEKNLLLTKKYFRHQLSAEDALCRAADKTVLIAPNGDVTTCHDCYGNIKKTPLRDIYRSLRAQKARERAARCAAPCLLPCFCDA